MTATITIDTLSNWIADKADESETLEFKRVLPEPSDKGKHEFLKDVIAMANASGGTIVYGIAEEHGHASEIVPVSVPSADASIRRLQQSLEASVEPRLESVNFAAINMPAGDYVLAVTVPRSFVGPHRVTLNGKNGFYVRSQRHVSEFSYQQLRGAFNLRGVAEDRIRQFRAERLARIKALRTPRPILGTGKMVYHVLPLSSFGELRQVELDRVPNDGYALMGGRIGSASVYRNLEGLVGSVYYNDESDSKYVQVFRSGIIETVTAISRHSVLEVSADRLAEEFRTALLAQASVLQSLGITGPASVCLTCISVGEYTFEFGYDRSKPDRDDYEIPEVWVESVDHITENVDSVAQPILDILWQCFDMPRCGHYSEQGVWKQPRR